MKLGRYLLALVSFTLAVASCSKGSVAPESGGPVSVEYVSVELEGTADEDIPVHAADGGEGSLRIAQELNADATRSVKSPILREKDLEVRVAVRRGSYGTPIAQTLIFKKVQGQNKVRYSGQIQVPAGTEKPQISAIVLREVGQGGEVFAILNGDGTIKPNVSSSLWGVGNVNGKSAVPSRIVYVASWSDIPLSNGKISNDRFPIHFKPSGSLLRVRIYNSSKNEVRRLRSIKVCSNAFVTDWKYDFRRLGKPDRKLLDGLFNGTDVQMASKTWEIAVPVEQNPQTYSGWYYFYVMPTEEKAVPHPYTEIKVTAEALPGGDPKEYYGWASSYRFKQGATPIELKTIEPTPGLAFGSGFPGQRVPVYYLPLTNDGYVKILSKKRPLHSLIDPRQYNPATDNYTLEEVEALLPGRHIVRSGIVTYKIPSAEEIRNIVSENQGRSFVKYPLSLMGTNTKKQFNNQYFTNNNGKPFYVFLHKDDSRRYYTAMRSELMGDYIKVTYRYLGPCSVGIQINNESFWQEHWPIDFTIYIRRLDYATSDIYSNSEAKKITFMRSYASSAYDRVFPAHLNISIASTSKNGYSIIPFPNVILP